MILTFDKANFFNEIIRSCLSGIDYILYLLISWILEGIFNLANLQANPNLVESVYKRVYVILALFMVFKITFSFLQYLVNPDAFTDKEKGVGKLISRTVVMLCMLVILPTILLNPMPGRSEGTILNVLQNGVLKTLPKLILGIDANPSGNASGTEDAAENGKSIASEMLKSFYYPSVCDDSPSSCNTSSVGLETFTGTVISEQASSDEYQYKYMWPLTTISAIFLILILLGIAVDVAIRSFKLLILQMIAPIPIMSYIDPKSSKDGAFSKWVHNYITTYLDLFFKLGTVYLLLMLLSELFNNENSLFENMSTTGTNFMAKNFVKVFLIIGLFKFAKDAPKFIKESLGIKDNGGGGLFGGLAGLGAAAGLAGGALLGGASGLAGGFNAASTLAKTQGKGKLGAALAGIRGATGGALAGTIRGGSNAFQGAKKGNAIKGIGGAFSKQTQLNAKKAALAAAGSTVMGRMLTSAQDAVGYKNMYDTAEEDAKSLAAAQANEKAILDRCESKGFENGSLAAGQVFYKRADGKYGAYKFLAGEHANYKSIFENARAHGETSFDAVVGGKLRHFDMNSGSSLYNSLKDKTAQTYLDESGASDGVVLRQAEEYNANMRKVSDSGRDGLPTSLISEVTDAKTGKTITKVKVTKTGMGKVGSASTKAYSIANSEGAVAHQANRNANKSGK